MKQRRRARITVKRLRRSLARAGDDDRQRVAARPTRPIHDLLNHRSNVWRLLIEASLTNRQPRRHRPPRDRRRSCGAGGDVVRRRRERDSVISVFADNGQIGLNRIRLIGLELDVRGGDARPHRDADAGKAHTHRLIPAGVKHQLQIAAPQRDTAPRPLLSIIRASRHPYIQCGCAALSDCLRTRRDRSEQRQPNERRRNVAGGSA